MKLWSADGKRFGTIEHVLFHPEKPHVVGFQILKTPWLYMIDRRPVFVPLDEVEITIDLMGLAPLWRNEAV